MTFRDVKMRKRNPKCVSCGEDPTVKSVEEFDYDEFCQTKCNKYDLIHIPPEHNIKVDEFEKEFKESEHKGESVLVDVRNKIQYDIVHLEKAINLPLSDIKKDQTEIKKLCEEKKKVFIMCRRGNASKEATDFLLNLGIKNIMNVQGGITEYAKEVDKTLPIY